ncbi:MAG: S1 RNA-binding domain-containing protein [Streptococcaceae bacterium]|nr:S1 RNA-binding domain-containing protein [Streptococcaceae bacterium]
MNNILGKKISAQILRESDDFYFMQVDEDLIRLAKSEGEHEIDEVVTGFVYKDKEERPCMTTNEIIVSENRYGWGTVTDVRRDLGVFLDIGLPNKDIVVSLDDLPEDKNQWPKAGDQLYVRLKLDNKERLWGQLAWMEDFWKLSGPAYDNMNNQNLRAIVYRNKESGTFVYLPDNNMLGFIHPNERYAVPRVGQELQVRVIGFRREDKSLNLSAKPRAHEMLDSDAQMILAYLESMGGKMPFNDKSDPEQIKNTFGISKGQFKKALGGLMKVGKITQDTEGTKVI